MTTATHTDTLLDALRRNLDLLSELAIRYDVETLPERESDPPTVSSPEDVCRLVGPEMSQLAQEQVRVLLGVATDLLGRRVLLLDRKNHVVGQRTIYQGNSYSAIVRPAEVFRPAVIEAVPHVIVLHNHPSADPTPSPEDIAVTQDLVDAAKLLRIDLLDHIVIGGPDDFVSLRDRGHIPA